MSRPFWMAQDAHEPYLPASEAGDNIVFSGDSQTANNYWPPEVLTALRGTPTSHNVAISGQTMANLTTIDAGTVDPLYNPSAKVNILFCWCGTNDVAAGTSGANMITVAQGYCAARKAVGWCVLLCTMLPRGNAPSPAQYETDRATYNTAIRAQCSTFADGLIDVAADARLGVAGCNTNATFFQSDSGAWVHINPTGGATIVATLAIQAYQTLKLRLFS